MKEFWKEYSTWQEALSAKEDYLLAGYKVSPVYAPSCEVVQGSYKYSLRVTRL